MLIASLINTGMMSLIMIGFGYLFVKKPPKEINYIYGYRTSMSTKNKDTWNYAHRYAGKVWLWSGIINAIVSIIIIFSLQNLNNYNKYILALIYIQVAILLLVIPLTEIKLRKVFDKKGNRKQNNY